MRYSLSLLALSSGLLLQCTHSNPSSLRSPSSPVIDKSGYAYNPADRSCDGYPRLNVGTMGGTCLGLAVPQEKAAWKMPRTIQQIPGTKDFLVVDMGGWAENRGALFWMKKRSDGGFDVSNVKSPLNMPHALKLGPDGLFYLGETDKVWRFRFENGKVSGWELVVAKLPRYKGYMHPLVELAFDPRNGDLYLNSGAPSDHCFVKNHGDYSDCPEDAEAGLAVIFRVRGDKLRSLPAGGITTFETAARGLRNSMAMAITPGGLLVQGENGRDFPQLEEPFEELNVVKIDEEARHYGWPYCYDFHAVSPEWKFSQNLGDPLHRRFTAPVDCLAKESTGPKTYQPPYALMPPHVAPLHLGYYPAQGQLTPRLQGKLLVSWHGYQPTGHRLVAYPVDARGLPRLSSQLSGKESYSFDVKGACPTQRGFRPEGGLDRFAAYEEVISRWDEQKGARPKGAPVGFTVADDGSIFVVEDKNRTVVRLAASADRANSASCEGPAAPTNDPRIELLAWRNHLETNPASKAAFEKLRDGVLLKHCTACHGSFAVNEIGTDGYSQLDFLVKNDFFLARDTAASKLVQALAATGEVPAMPPADVPLSDQERSAAAELARAWIRDLPVGGAGVMIRRTAMTGPRKLRAAPGVGATECGQVAAGDVVYVDPRPEQQRKADGWAWSKVYMLPGDSRLFKNACAYPVDGVYYLATVKL